MRQGSVVLALFLGGALSVGLLLLMPHVVESAPSTAPASPRDLLAPSQVEYKRVQTVTIRPAPLSWIYNTAFTTTFQIGITDYVLGSWLRLPDDAVVYTDAVSCIATSPPTATCEVLYGTHVITFAGDGIGDIYLEYDTSSKAWRDPGARAVTLNYAVGPFDPTRQIGLTNTIIFGRSFNPLWQLASVSPGGYAYDTEGRTLRWAFTSTPWLEFTAVFTEPLLGADLVVERLEMSNIRPEFEEPVRYTITVRNEGPYVTGRAVLAELLVRPVSFGVPVVLTDHVGGWGWEDEHGVSKGYRDAALFKWITSTPPISWSYWRSGLVPGEVVTGTTVLTWPNRCSVQRCGVWAKVDPSYLDLGTVYAWYGYNPEGVECGLDNRNLPTCGEENNNIATALHFSNLPQVLRNSNVE